MSEKGTSTLSAGFLIRWVRILVVGQHLPWRHRVTYGLFNGTTTWLLYMTLRWKTPRSLSVSTPLQSHLSKTMCWRTTNDPHRPVTLDVFEPWSLLIRRTSSFVCSWSFVFYKRRTSYKDHGTLLFQGRPFLFINFPVLRKSVLSVYSLTSSLRY